MKALIVEDELLAAKKLERILLEIDPNISVVETTDSVKNTAKWLANNEAPDLIFMDIQLGDGVCFEVFEIVDVKCPIIVITAFNEYAQEAFKVNSIDYLLKPVSKEEVASALDKYHTRKAQFDMTESASRMSKAKEMLETGYKSRFMVKIGSHIVSIPVDEIAYFFSRDKATFFKTNEGRSYLTDYSLEQVEEMTDSGVFFRVNRKYLVAFQSISDIITFSNSRFKIMVSHMEEPDILVSRHRVGDFKKWLDR
jgi:DNA-binding LytR/AlgR family response regulator